MMNMVPGGRKWTERILGNRILLGLLAGCVAVLVYAGTLGNEYALDDHVIIAGNPLIERGVGAAADIFTTPYHHGKYQFANDLYRPLSLLLFAAERQLFGPSAFWGHLINLLLYAGCVIGLFVFVCGLWRNARLAFVASLFFAVLPVHTEVVANIKSSDELLCFLLSILSLNSFLRYARGSGSIWMLGGAIAFFMSLFAKESSITLIAVVPLVISCFGDSKRRVLISTTVSLLCAGAYLYIRSYVLHKWHADHFSEVTFIDNALAAPWLPVSDRLATAVLMLGYYLRLLVMPSRLVCDYSYHTVPFVHPGNGFVIMTMVIYLSLFIVAVARIIKDRRDVYGFSILYFLITISLFANILFLLGTTMAERFLFFPSAGFCIAMGWLVCSSFSSSGLAVSRYMTATGMVGVTIIIALYGLIVIKRGAEWADNYTLFSADLASAPDNCRLNCYLASEILQPADPEQGHADYADAVRHLQKAISIYPDYADANGLLGLCYEHGYGVNADTALALKYYTVSAGQGSVVSENSLGKLYCTGCRAMPADYSAAVKWFRLSAGTGNMLAQYVLGQIYEAGMGNVARNDAEAMHWYTLAARQGHANSQYRLGFMLESGEGVSPDAASAARWYAQADAQGQLMASGRLGELYVEGRGVSADKQRGVMLLHKAADAGHTEYGDYLRSHGLQ
jgi:protein O-mannosyl-transferase